MSLWGLLMFTVSDLHKAVHGANAWAPAAQ